MSHKVTISELPILELSHADLIIKVKRNNGVLGHLLISKGAIEWRPRNKQILRKLNWDRFDTVMRENARKKK